MRRLRAVALRHMPRRAVAAAVAPLALAGCLPSAADDQRQESVRTGVLQVGQRGDTAASWVVDDRLQVEGLGAQRLATPVNATLIATLAPVAVPHPAGRTLVYNSWRGRRPTLRLRDLRTGRDSLLDEGAHSAAVARAGRLAYFKALSPDLRDARRYVGHVVVRRSQRARPRAWTARPGRYVVAAWAARRVVFYRLGTTFPDLLVLDGPRRQRLLARGSALVALSPDGRRAFISRYGASPPLVRVVDIKSGVERARLEVGAGGVKYVVESGSWTGDLVAAATTTGIAVLRVGDATIELEQVLRAGLAFSTGLSEPRAADGGRRVVAWGETPSQPRQAVPQAALVECDRLTLRCVRAATGTSTAPPRPVYNPSRP